MADETPLVLDQDQAFKLQEHFSEARNAAYTGSDFFKKGILTIEFTHTLISLLEQQISGLSKLTGYESAVLKERDDLTAKVRKGNVRIRELENQLGAGQGDDALRAQLRFLGNKLDAWWSGELMAGWVREATFDKHGYLTVKCGFSFDRWPRIYQKKPVTRTQRAEETLKHLQEEGWEFVKEDRDHHLIDNDNNRGKLIALLTAALPTATIMGFEHRRLHRSKEDTAPPAFYITDVNLRIWNLNEVKNLPGEIANE